MKLIMQALIVLPLALASVSAAAFPDPAAPSSLEDITMTALSQNVDARDTHFTGGMCRFHATIHQVCYKENIMHMQNAKTYVFIPTIRGGDNQPKNDLAGAVNKWVQVHDTFDNHDPGSGSLEKIYSINGHNLEMMWFSWNGGDSSKMTYAFNGCQWSEDDPKFCGWCGRGLWTSGSICGDVPERYHDMDCYFLC